MLDWDDWCGDYGLVRDAIAETYPNIFANFNTRIQHPAGFDRPTRRGSACGLQKLAKPTLFAPQSVGDPDLPRTQVDEVLTLITVRSNDQFNTTVYSYEDRLRGIHGTRNVVLMNKNDIEERPERRREVDLIGQRRRRHRVVHGFRAVRYDVPPGSRWVLPRMQSVASAVAPRRTQPCPSREIDPRQSAQTSMNRQACAFAGHQHSQQNDTTTSKVDMTWAVQHVT